MASRWLAELVVGVFLVLAGSTFALQGVNVIGGTSPMNGSPTWVYLGTIIAVGGLIMAAMGLFAKPAAPTKQ